MMKLKTRVGVHAVVLSAAMFSAIPAVHAADCGWSGATDGNWAKPENWTGGKVPTAQQVASFGPASNADISLDGDVTVGGVAFTDGAASYTISGHAINLAKGGFIRKVTGSGDHPQTIGSDVHLTDATTFSCDDKAFDNFGNMLMLKGHLSGSGALTISGSDGGCGGVCIAADNRETFTGPVTLNSGLLLVQGTGALGSAKSPVTLKGGQFMCFGGVETQNAFRISGKVTWESSGGNSHTGPILLDPKAVWTIGNGGGNPLTLGGAISGSGTIHMVCGNTTLEGADSNTFSGPMHFSTDSNTDAYNELRLAKTGGAIAIAGPLELGKKATIVWQGDEEISPRAPLTLAGGKLSFNGHSNKLGVLILTDAAEIDLGGGKSVVHFASCSASKWAPKGQLLIHGWADDTGAKIFFGTGANGLSPAQLADIGFDSPDGKPTGIYRAKISASGELTPTDTAAAPVNPPFDVSAAADADREKLCAVDGLAEITGPGTPLKAGEIISIFGDSITWLNTYITDMREAIAKSETTSGLNVTLINHGINGGGVLQVRDGSPNASFNGKDNGGAQDAFAKVIEADKANIAVVYIGINDVWWRKTSAADFEKGMRDIVAAAKANKTTLVLATMALHGEKPDGSNADDKKIEQFSQITRDVATSTGTTLVDLRKDYIAYMQNHNRQMHIDGSLSFKPSGTLTYDGVHPTAEGAKFLAELISDGIYRAAKAPSPN